MKKTTLLFCALSLVRLLIAQTSSDYICENGFSLEFDLTEPVVSSDSLSNLGVFWYGCGETGLSTAPECNDVEHQITRNGDGNLTIATYKPNPLGNWAPVGFAMSDPENNEVIDISSTNEVAVSYTNTSDVPVEVYWSFTSKDSPSAEQKLVMADENGVSLGGIVAAGATVDRTFKLDECTRRSWSLSSEVCEEDKGGIFSGGLCIWDDGFDPAKLLSVEITITGEAKPENSWVPEPLDGETVVFQSISGGSADCDKDIDEEIDDEEDTDDEGNTDDVGDTDEEGEDYRCADGFNLEFNEIDPLVSWFEGPSWGMAWDSDDVEHKITRNGDGNLTIATYRPLWANWGHLATVGFYISDPENNEVVDVSSNNEVSVSYTNTSDVSVEVYWIFTSKDSPSAEQKLVMADENGISLGGVIAAGQKVYKTFQLNTGTRTSWVSEEECEEDKDGIYYGGECVWDDGFDPSKLFSVEIEITGLATEESYWLGGPLNGETIKLDYIRAGSDCGFTSCEYLRTNYETIQPFDCSTGTTIIKAKGVMGYPGYTYNWSDAGIQINDSTIEVDTSGLYEVIVTDSENCADTSSIYVPENPFAMESIDLEPFFINSEFRTGFTRLNSLKLINKGCQNASGEIYIVLDDLTTYLPYLDISADRVSADTLFWTFSDFNADSINFEPLFDIETSVLAAIGDTVCFTVGINYNGIEENEYNNSKVYCFPIINGYDPNDISVHPSSCPAGYVKNDDVLTYKIRFQNTGNAEAININVMDTLSPYLDSKTLNVIGTSHPDILKTFVLNDSVIHFAFEEIWLKDSMNHEPESHGHILYQIKQKTNLALGTEILNKADIYFDYNPAVLTNTVISTVTDVIPQCKSKITGEYEVLKNKGVIYPNPNTGRFTIYFEREINEGKIDILNVQGKNVYTKIIDGSKSEEVSVQLSKGIYFVNIRNATGSTTQKVVVK